MGKRVGFGLELAISTSLCVEEPLGVGHLWSFANLATLIFGFRRWIMGTAEASRKGGLKRWQGTTSEERLAEMHRLAALPRIRRTGWQLVDVSQAIRDLQAACLVKSGAEFYLPALRRLEELFGKERVKVRYHLEDETDARDVKMR
jgi:hypothetical protein